MARSKSDISNSAIRIFLQEVGRFYDEERGFAPFVPKVGQKDALLKFFHSTCCYCGKCIDEKTLSLDHLIPMNKTALGLHAWGNVVPCCRDCNDKKQQINWEKFLSIKCSGTEFDKRKARINKFVAEKKYDPTLNLHKFAGNLYEDVGEVVMTLIRLRYKQAESEIKAIIATNNLIEASKEPASPESL